MSGDGGVPRVLIAEDDVLMREGLAKLLADAGFDVIDQVGNAAALLTLARRHRPDLVILDIRMPPTHTTEGLDAARTIREELPEIAARPLRPRRGRAGVRPAGQWRAQRLPA